MGDVIFITWRESVEALLVVGILHAWLAGQPAGRRGLRWLWAGVGLGQVAALVLGLAILGAASVLDGESGEWFQAAMVSGASALIVHMAVWMRHHGRGLKYELEQRAGQHLAAANGWGLALLAALAIAREGSETVIFLYGAYGAATQPGGSAPGLGRFVVSVLAGLLAAGASYWLLQASRRWLSWHSFFRVSEALLLLLAAALLMSATDRLIGLGVLPTLVDPLWNTSALLDDGQTLGRVAADFTGYRAAPALSSVLVYAAFWAGVAWLLHRQPAGAAMRAARTPPLPT